jgi:RNA polymerase sigma-70 factor (ECF subfamily)
MKARETKRLHPDRWVPAYGEALLGYARARVGNGGAAEDLVQETYFAALRARKSFKGRSSEKTWLFGILKHKILDHLRSARTAPLSSAALQPPGDGARRSRPQGRRVLPWAQPVPDPDEVYHYRELVERLSQGLSKLPQRAAQVFVSREIDGLSTEEVCRRFGISRFNCWTIVHRARAALRENLEVYGFKPTA